MPDEYRWKLDRHIPIAVIFTIMMQTGVAIWWMADMNSRLNQETARNERQDAQIDATEAALASQEVAAATATAELRAVREGLAEVKTAIADQNVLLREILTNGKDKP